MTRLRIAPPPVTDPALVEACPAGLSRRKVDCGSCQVRHLAVCSALNAEESAELERTATLQRLEPGEFLVREGQARVHVYSVTGGALRMVRLLADGRRQVTGFLLPGDFIGLSNSPTHARDVEAVSASTLCRFSQQDMRQLRARFPQIERKLLERAFNELDASREHIVALARMSPLERLADFLLKMSARQARLGQGGEVLVLPMGRSDIADHLGLTVETVSRSFTKLRQRRLIALHGVQNVEILDREGLAAIVHRGA